MTHCTSVTVAHPNLVSAIVVCSALIARQVRLAVKIVSCVFRYNLVRSDYYLIWNGLKELKLVGTIVLEDTWWKLKRCIKFFNA